MLTYADACRRMQDSEYYEAALARAPANLSALCDYGVLKHAQEQESIQTLLRRYRRCSHLIIVREAV